MTLISDATICETHGIRFRVCTKTGSRIDIPCLGNLPQSRHLPLDLLRRDIPRLGAALG